MIPHVMDVHVMLKRMWKESLVEKNVTKEIQSITYTFWQGKQIKM